jgi:aspartate dehydrogenase
LKNIALIGFGAIGQELLRLLEPHPVRVTAVLVRRELEANVRVVHTLEALLETQPGLVIECAGHQAVQQYGAAVLRAGFDLMISSVGALCDHELEFALHVAKTSSGARLLVPSGAIGALDALASAKIAGLDRVVYTSRKPTKAWRGTPAEDVLDLESLRSAHVFYSGSARVACRDYPQNANVAAAVALAGLGFDRTEVHLIADPDASSNTHLIHAQGTFGELEFRISNAPLVSNPKTSAITPASLVQMVLNQHPLSRVDGN